MGRRPATLMPATQLGLAMTKRRGHQQQRDVARELGTTDATISRIERGLNVPTPDLALGLARWLGWTMEQVYEAARQPAEGSSS